MYRRQAIGFLATAVAAGAASCLGDDQRAPAPRNEEKVRITRHELVREEEGTEDETVAIEGKVELVGDAEVGYVELEAKFLDEQREVLDRTTATLEEFEEPPFPFRIVFPHFGERAATVADYEIEIGTVL